MTRVFRLDPTLLHVAPDAFVAPGVVCIGDVHIDRQASVWFGAVLRGDTERIRVGPRANVQDGSVVHADPGFPALIGREVTVGHRCVIHGARIDEGALIGMNATLLNGSHVGESALVGAGALVPEGMEIPPRTLAVGVPAKVRRALSEEEVKNLRESAAHYVDAGRAYLEAGHR